MKFIDWFAGIGGFRRGMELAGHQCVGFCEYDKFATASYTSMHLITEEQRGYLSTLPLRERQKEILKEEYRNGEWYRDDIREVRGRDVPDANCWCFGFPCQDISCAGKMLGFSGNRSSLFFEVMRLLDERKENGFELPEFLFIENVKNLLSVSRGFDFASVLSSLDERGYDAEWSVLNSKDFGVPQNRERVFIIGYLRGRDSSEVFPVEGTDGANSVHGIGHKRGYRRNLQIFDGDGITEALDTAAGGGRGHHTIEIIGSVYCNVSRNPNFKRGIYDIENGVRCLKSKQHDTAVVLDVGDEATAGGGRGHHTIEIIGKMYDRSTYGDNRNRILGVSGISPAQTATQYKEPYRVGICIDEMPESAKACSTWYPPKQCYISIRKLTPRECFRLQGWADDYFTKAQFVNSDSQLYKQAGNGVTVSVIKAIADKMKI